MNKLGIVVLLIGIILIAGSGIVYYYSAQSCGKQYYVNSGAYGSCIFSLLPASGIIGGIGLVGVVIGLFFALGKEKAPVV